MSEPHNFTINRITVRLSALLLAAGLLLGTCFTAYAEPETMESPEAEETVRETGEEAPEERSSLWPEFTANLSAVSACVIDADTGEVLYGKDEHTKRYPASVTKILTALLTCEQCSLSEEVTFSESATTNLESGAVTIGTAAGDVLTVEECLYALLLKSANEVANALAEHISGSVEDFCTLMNERAVSLGCLHSDFHNPNGLTNEKHVTTAYDMALIAAACMNDPVFMEIEKSTSYHISHTAKYPDGLTVSMGHKMLHEEEPYYDSRVTAGKTGFTSASGNTLVTMAEYGGRRVAAVVLKDTNPQHYEDTKALLDFAFSGFSNLTLSPDEIMETFDPGPELLKEGIIPGGEYEISLAKSLLNTIPKEADPSLLTLVYDTDLPENAPELAKAVVRLSFDGHTGTKAYVFARDLSLLPEVEVEETFPASETAGSGETEGENGPAPFTLNVKVILLAMAVFAGVSLVSVILYFVIRRKKEEKARLERIRKRRAERLKDLEPSVEAVDGESPEEEFSEQEKEDEREENPSDDEEIHDGDEEETTLP